MPEPAVSALLEALSQEVRELGGTLVERVENPSALVFLRDFVATNRPCIITGVVGAWPAASRWTDDAYLRAATGAAPVAVNVTPHGRGDAVLPSVEHGGDVFVLPQEQRMPFGDFLTALDASLDDSASASVPYVSAQDGSLTRDFPALAADVPAELPWATEAFGAPPDAVNMWCGNDRSVSSFHHDHYENMYAVIVGEKRFTLLPPCDSRLLQRRRCPVGRFEQGHNGGWHVALESPPRRVSWATVDPHPEAGVPAADPAFIEVTVRAGELLYLPSLWHHYVRQAGRRVIAVNWWHDMRFDSRYAYFKLVRKLEAAGGSEDASDDDD